MSVDFDVHVEVFDVYGGLADEIDPRPAATFGVEMVHDTVVDRIQLIAQVFGPEALDARTAVGTWTRKIDPIVRILSPLDQDMALASFSREGCRSFSDSPNHGSPSPLADAPYRQRLQ
jgi:hypothetical protein